MLNNKILRIIRRQRGLTQNDVADAVGVTPVAYQHWESGKNQPQPENLNALCEVLNTSSTELLLTLPETLQEEAMIALMDMKADILLSKGEDDYHDKLVRYHESLLKTIKTCGGLPVQPPVTASVEKPQSESTGTTDDSDIDDYVNDIVKEQQKKAIGQELIKTDDGKTIFSPPKPPV